MDRFVNFQPHSLPRPPGYGYVGNMTTAPVPTSEIEPLQLPTPEDMQAQTQAGFLNIPIPEISVVEYGACDPNVIRNLLAIANDRTDQSDYTTISKDYAIRKLNEWGYPLDPAAWTADEWTAAMAQRQQPNLAAILGGYATG